MRVLWNLPLPKLNDLVLVTGMSIIMATNMKTRLKVKCSALKRKRPTKEAVSTKTGTRCSPKSSTGLNKPLNTRVLSL